MENKMLTAPGEELTEEIQKGLDDAKKDGFKYFKSPTEMFSAMDAMNEQMDKIEAYCDTVKVQAYSKIKSFSDLVVGIRDLVAKSKSNFGAEYQAKIDTWVKEYDQNPTSEVFSEELKKLKTELTDGDWMNSKAYEDLHLNISKMLDEYNEATGELFFFSSIPVAEKVESPAPTDYEKRDDVVFYLADNGFHKQSESSYAKDLQGYEVTVDIGGDKASIHVSGERTYDATVSLERVPMEVNRWLRQPQTYSRSYPTENRSAVESYSRSYAQTSTRAEPKAESYTSRIMRMIGL